MGARPRLGTGPATGTQQRRSGAARTLRCLRRPARVKGSCAARARSGATQARRSWNRAAAGAGLAGAAPGARRGARFGRACARASTPGREASAACATATRLRRQRPEFGPPTAPDRRQGLRPAPGVSGLGLIGSGSGQLIRCRAGVDPARLRVSRGPLSSGRRRGAEACGSVPGGSGRRRPRYYGGP